MLHIVDNQVQGADERSFFLFSAMMIRGGPFDFFWGGEGESIIPLGLGNREYPSYQGPFAT